MTSPPGALQAGTELPPASFTVTRGDLVRYAGASGDFNEIHWSDRTAREAGLPGVVAHGMYLMARAGTLLAAWVGDPTALREYTVRFARPVVVPDTGQGARIEVTGKLTKLLDERSGQVELTVTHEGRKVLGRATAIIYLP